MLREAFPLTVAIWLMKDICVSVLGCSLRSPLFAEDAPKFASDRATLFMFIIVEGGGVPLIDECLFCSEELAMTQAFSCNPACSPRLQSYFPFR